VERLIAFAMMDVSGRALTGVPTVLVGLSGPLLSSGPMGAKTEPAPWKVDLYPRRTYE
jgi:hypothetical protein